MVEKRVQYRTIAKGFLNSLETFIGPKRPQAKKTTFLGIQVDFLGKQMVEKRVQYRTIAKGILNSLETLIGPKRPQAKKTTFFRNSGRLFG